MTGEFHFKQPNDRGELLEDEDAERSGRVMQAMLQMEKIDIEGLGVTCLFVRYCTLRSHLPERCCLLGCSEKNRAAPCHYPRRSLHCQHRYFALVAVFWKMAEILDPDLILFVGLPSSLPRPF